jgi:hypothetical protein
MHDIRNSGNPDIDAPPFQAIKREPVKNHGNNGRDKTNPYKKLSELPGEQMFSNVNDVHAELIDSTAKIGFFPLMNSLQLPDDFKRLPDVFLKIKL